MPLSEFLRMARGKLESGQQKPCPTDPSPRSENDLVELVWENGQIVMQGQSSRATRNSLPSNTSRVRDAGVGHAANTSRFGKFGGVESFLEDVTPAVPSGDLDDEMVPWLSYPIDDALGQDYASELLPEISGVTGNGMSAHHSLVSMDKRSSCGQTVSNLHSGGDTLKGSSSSKDRVVCSWAPQHRQTSDALGSGVSDIVDASRKMERQNTRPPTNNTSNFLNFSHFSRPANLVKPVERVEVKEKPMLVERFSSVPKDIEFRGSSSMVNSKEPVAKASNETSPAERTENLCQETSVKNDSSAKGVPGCERTVEPMVATSSVGSGNSADRVSCEQTHNSKRKFRDIEESECRSDDVETEYLDAKKRTGVRGSKRSRAAEVHNLSERRRRDRINEKMRALQELIPNCNKADKASMLDEAIEYLKTLQLQVQIMSMGAGLCMPPMMFPTGIQHMHPAHIPHFPPMGVGMGYGMGMLDMNGGSSGYPIFPIPPMQLPHFPPGSGITNFPRIPGQNRPVFGHHGQGLPNSVPRPPFIPFSGPPPMTSAMGSTAMRDEVANASPVANAEAGCSINDTSNQQQATTANLDLSAAVQENKQGSVARGPTALGTTDISKQPGCD